MVLGLVIFAYAVYIIFSESDPVELIDEPEGATTEMVEESNKNILLTPKPKNGIHDAEIQERATLILNLPWILLYEP